MNHKIPPGPKGHWLMGNFPEFRRDILGLFQQCARDYGDVVRFRLPNMPAYLITHPDHIEYVLVTANRNFKKHKVWRHLSSVFRNGLLTSEGDFWIRQRRLAQPAFHRNRIGLYGKIMVEFTERMLRNWQDGQVLDVHQELMTLTMQIVAKTLFNADVSKDAKDVGNAMDIVMHEFQTRFGRPFFLPEFIPTPGNLRFRKAIRRFNKTVYEIIHERRATGENTGDLLSMLLEAQDEDGSRMTDEQLRDEIITLFLAGHETTAIALCWTFYALSMHRAIEAKVIEEIDNIIADHPVAVSDLEKLKYTEMVILESMRLYPPAYAFGREAIHDCEIGGYHVPAGTTIFLSQYVTQRDPRFFENPLEFHPERWKNDFAKKIPKFAYFPFSGGPRQCIGNSFAMMEAVLLLVTILREFHLELVPNHPVVPQASITMRPKFGLKMMLHRRPSNSE